MMGVTNKSNKIVNYFVESMNHPETDRLLSYETLGIYEMRTKK